MSENSSKFLVTRKIAIFAPNAKIALNKDDIVFVKFNGISINNNKLVFSTLEVYKYFPAIEKAEKSHVSWWVPNDFGGFIRYTGNEFLYKGNSYVDYDKDISEDGKQYFVDIYDEKLLFEEYKSIFPLMKWYNMVNPQETYFDIIVDIYKNEI